MGERAITNMPIKLISVSAQENQLSDRKRYPSAEMDKLEITEKDQPSTTPARIRGHARFNRAVFVRETLHIADYEPHEVMATWYQKDEMAQMKADMVDTVRSMLRGELEHDSDEQCMRGLESRTRIGANKRQENKLRALEAVLDEQDREFEAGFIDERAISLVYQRVSLRCRNEAHERGVRDEIEAYGKDGDFSGCAASERPKGSRRRIHELLKRAGSKSKQMTTASA